MFVKKVSRKQFLWQEGAKQEEFRVFGEDGAGLFCDEILNMSKGS